MQYMSHFDYCKIFYMLSKLKYLLILRILILHMHSKNLGKFIILMNIFDPKTQRTDKGLVQIGTFASKNLVGSYIKTGDNDLIINKYRAIGNTSITNDILNKTIAELETHLKKSFSQNWFQKIFTIKTNKT